MSNRLRCIGALLASLLLAPPGLAANQIQLRLDGLSLPLDLKELEVWTNDPGHASGDLELWLRLMSPADRRGLQRVLKAPMLKQQSFGFQLLSSPAGEPLVAALGAVLTTADGTSTAPLLVATLRRLLKQQPQVSVLDVLRALPSDQLTLHLDRLLALADRWRGQVQQQSDALRQLRSLPLPLRKSIATGLEIGPRQQPVAVNLVVAHRAVPLPLEIWTSTQRKPGPWVLLMSGLGGNSNQLRWLAQGLAEGGWPVVLLEHPGSDERALQDSLVGLTPPPGADALPMRLADIQAVLTAQREGALPPLGPEPTGRQGVVLMGHSLGALAALMGSGLTPETGVARRCQASKAELPLANLSELLQCQLPRITGDGSPAAVSPSTAPVPVLGVVAFNGFGSVLWPHAGLAGLTVPVLMVGGSVDLVTPPVQEQLQLFSHAHHPRSRLVVVDGGSHFSMVRVENQRQALFRLGEELVGRDPRKVQALVLNLTTEFLLGFDYPFLLPPQRRLQDGVSAFVMDPAMARRWQGLVKPWP
jgi:predicted dienelactone hydrolase